MLPNWGEVDRGPSQLATREAHVCGGTRYGSWKLDLCELTGGQASTSGLFYRLSMETTQNRNHRSHREHSYSTPCQPTIWTDNCQKTQRLRHLVQTDKQSVASPHHGAIRWTQYEQDRHTGCTLHTNSTQRYLLRGQNTGGWQRNAVSGSGMALSHGAFLSSLQTHRPAGMSTAGMLI